MDATKLIRHKSGSGGSQVAAKHSYCACLGKLEGKGSVIMEMGTGMGDKVEGTITVDIPSGH